MPLSIIMPAFNVERYIEQAIRSLLVDRGTLQLDIIVLDDGSTDSTVDVVREIMRRHPEVRLTTGPHRGISATRNLGLDLLPDDAELVTFHDADDIAYPGRLARQVARLEATPEAQVVYGLVQFFDVLDEDTLLPGPQSRTMTMRTIQLSSGIYRRQVIEQVGRFDETLEQAEDTDFLFRLVETGAYVLMEDEIATFYRRHDTNTTRDVRVARRDFLKAIHKSVKRRRSSTAKSGASLISGIFRERAQLEELFETCPTATPL